MDRHSIFLQSRDAMALCDEHRRITEVNPALGRFLGRDPGRLPGRVVDELLARREPRGPGPTIGSIFEDGDGGQRSSGWVPCTVAGPGGAPVAAEVLCRPRFLPERHLVVFRPVARGRLAQADGGLLNEREREVLGQVAAGRTGAEIARTLFLSSATVERHVANALRKLGANNRAHGIALALSSGELAGAADAASPESVLGPGDGEPHREVLAALDDPAAILDGDARVLAANQAWRELGADNGRFGAPEGESYLEVFDRAARAGDEDAARAALGLREVLEDQCAVFTMEYRHGAPGCPRWFEMRATRFRVQDSAALLVRHRDLTERRRAEEQMTLGKSLLDEVEAAIILLALNGDVTGWQAGAEEIFGWTAEEAAGRKGWDLAVQRSERPAGRWPFDVCVRDGRWAGELRLQRKDGSHFDARVRLRLLEGEDGEPTGVVCVAVDVSRQVRAQRALLQAYEELRAISQSMRQGCVVLDSMGSMTRVSAAAERLLGWEEAELLGRNMHEVLRSPLPITTRMGDLRTGPAGPVHDDCFVTRNGVEVPVEYTATPFVRGDGADGWVVLFDEAAQQTGFPGEAGEPELVAAIRRALLQDGFSLFEQCIVDLSDGRTHAHELLLRLAAPDGTLVYPERVLPLAARHGLLPALDRWVCRTAVRTAAVNGRVHFNVSGASLADDALVGTLRDALRDTGVDPETLTVEVPGRAMVAGGAPGLRFARGLDRLGCGLVIDDFGGGPTALTSLRRLPGLRALKLDLRSLPDPADDETARAMIRAIVELAGGHGATTIAHGVEDEGTADVLREHGVAYAQGHLYGVARRREEPVELEGGADAEAPPV